MIDGFGGKWIRRGMKGKPIRTNPTCPGASKLAGNPIKLGSLMLRKKKEEELSAFSLLYCHIAAKRAGTEEPKLVSSRFRVGASPPHGAALCGPSESSGVDGGLFCLSCNSVGASGGEL